MISIVPAAATGRPRLLALLILIIANMVPLAGILVWGWDAFVLLCLYWLETIVIGFWTILRMATLSRESGSVAGRSIASTLALSGFFVVHAGLFMTVHMLFLFSLFAGPWAARIHDARSFIGLIVIGKSLWIPLLALFLGQGAIFVNDAVNRFVFTKAPPADADTGSIMGSFYQRIVLMHVAIIGGAFIVEAIGNTAPLVVLVLLKTALEIQFQLKLRQQNQGSR